jgi:hypothetical protein
VSEELTAKAWQRVLEAREVVDTLTTADLPGDLATAATSVFELWIGTRMTSISSCLSCSFAYAPTPRPQKEMSEAIRNSLRFNRLLLILFFNIYSQIN